MAGEKGKVMQYYKVKAEHDNERRYKFHKGGGLEIDGIYIKNELYTAKELNRYLGGFKVCEAVELPKSGIYFAFGVRFAREDNKQ